MVPFFVASFGVLGDARFNGDVSLAPERIARDGQGRLLVGGDAGFPPFVARLDDGALDPAVGAGGLVTLDAMGPRTLRSLLVRPEGLLCHGGGAASHCPLALVTSTERCSYRPTRRCWSGDRCSRR